jgi:hypothetical protein
MTFGIDAFNVLNRVNDVGYIATLSSPFFGRAVPLSRRDGSDCRCGHISDWPPVAPLPTAGSQAPP